MSRCLPQISAFVGLGSITTHHICFLCCPLQGHVSQQSPLSVNCCEQNFDISLRLQTPGPLPSQGALHASQSLGCLCQAGRTNVPPLLLLQSATWFHRAAIGMLARCLCLCLRQLGGRSPVLWHDTRRLILLLSVCTCGCWFAGLGPVFSLSFAAQCPTQHVLWPRVSGPTGSQMGFSLLHCCINRADLAYFVS